MGIKKSHNIVISERIFTIKVSLERSCSVLNEDVFILKTVQKRRRGKTSKFELGSLPSIDRDRCSRGAEFRRRLLPWQLVVLSTKCKKPPRIGSRKNELRSCSTGEEQLVSALKAPRPDFASVFVMYPWYLRCFFVAVFAICCAMKRPFQRWVFHYDRVGGC